jgi:hypothetical protein
MGRSAITYGTKKDEGGIASIGFWVSDTDICAYQYMLVLEISKLMPVPAWLLDEQKTWAAKATREGVGWFSVDLDRYITNDERKQQFLLLNDNLLSTLEEYGEFLPNDLTTILEEWEGVQYENYSGHETKYIKQVCKYARKLLNGELTWWVGEAPNISGLPFD